MMTENKFKTGENIFTEYQSLFETIGCKKLIELINHQETKIISLKQSYNSYGNFYFLKLEINNNQYIFYGLGFHEYKNKYYVNEFKFNHVQTCLVETKYEPLNKKDILSQLNKLKIKIQKLSDSFTGEPDEEYEMIAEMADEDYAISNFY